MRILCSAETTAKRLGRDAPRRKRRPPLRLIHYAHGIVYRYDAKFRIIDEFQIRPDFYLPELDVYIEYWGLDTPQYKMSMYKKQMLYQQEGKRLISVYPHDVFRLDALLSNKLRLLGYAVNPSGL